MLGAVRRTAVLFTFALGVQSAPALADLRVFESVKRYAVDATTKIGLRRQFRSRGPNGFAGLTNWSVSWTATCNVMVRITYTLPQHSNPSLLPQDVLQRFERMVANLEAHERLHGAHGIKAGQEILQNGCQDGKAIISKYAAADRRLDKETRHGVTQGVTLD